MPRNALIQLRRDTAANWTSVNPILASGEIGYETDLNRFKVGDGTNTWSALNYSSSGGMSVGATPPSSPSNGSPWFNTNDGTLYIYYDDGVGSPSSQWVQIQASSSLEGSFDTRLAALEASSIFPIRLNTQTISANYAIPSGYNGLTAGPVTIADGVIVTIPDGSAWSIV